MTTQKILAGIGTLLSFSGLMIQFSLNMIKAYHEGLNYLFEIFKFLSYMTIWTNILVFLCFLAAFIGSKTLLGYFLQPGIKAGSALFIVIVGLVYHFMLSSIYHPQNWGKVANSLLHYVVPVGYFAYWILIDKKLRLPYLETFKWLMFPFIYATYSLIKGAFLHQYPYPFLDVTVLGYPQTISNVFALGIFYILSGWIIIAINNQLASKDSVKSL